MRRIIIAAAGGVALIAAAVIVSDAPAGHKARSGRKTQPLNVAATTVGTTSTMWAIDARTSQVLFCSAQVGAAPSCKAVAMPGAAQP
ncbi:hypothetical protein E6W36_12870 [Hankyongella ginsenosidimutans]|uniref:Uncharacterized protein n=1 Tax=Hankyongella ginsenosidimutans TaxID=1763828 RepID=A0A4D7C7L7_9SPHN|nr:hypothetical protein [Hankyongella ginsenosidimutans]QCI80080.1 hypothetical protein E6W36_12870 [Hankyongella ginsenosidimutans]